MSGRPTPEQIWRDYPATYPARLKQHGYVIVHPDDVPLDVEQGSGSLYANAYGLGWNNCHRPTAAAAAEQETP